MTITKSLKLAEQGSMHVYEMRPRKDHRVVDLISDALPFNLSRPNRAPERFRVLHPLAPSHHVEI
jgi:hypothetical protein